MKTIKMVSSLLACCLLLTSIALYTGCEDSPSGEDIDALLDGSAVNTTATLSPNDRADALTILPATPATITHIGQRLEFEVQGGHWPYSWDIADKSRGRIDVEQNDSDDQQFTAVYTVEEVAVNTIIVQDASNRTGTKELTAGTAAGPTLMILPDMTSITVSNATSTGTMYVIGGVPPYHWVSDDNSCAGLAFTNNATVTATSNNVDRITWYANADAGTGGLGGDYYIFVYDSAEKSDQVKFILQP